MVFIWCWNHVNFVIKGVFMGKYIESIYAKNIGKYKEAKVIFNPRFNFLVGANGCGKTTILKYMAIILNPTPVYNFFNKKMPHKAFCCIMNLTKTLQRIVTLYDKLIIQ